MKMRRGAVYIVWWPNSGIFKVGAGNHRSGWFENHTGAAKVWTHSTPTWIAAHNYEALIHQAVKRHYRSAFGSGDECERTLGFRDGWTECYRLHSLPLAYAERIAAGILRHYCEGCHSASCTNVRTYELTENAVTHSSKASPKSTRATREAK